jgi:hypothetical protein
MGDKWDLPEDLAALLEETDPRTCQSLTELAKCVNRSPVTLILDALGEFELLNVYDAGFSNGIRFGRGPADDDEPPF